MYLNNQTTLNEMAYPANFDMAHFKSLKSFAKRVDYCKQTLKKISSGSSRIIFAIDNEKVLKLAYNSKGLEQNRVESDWSLQNYDDVLAKTFESDENNQWVEMELAYKVKKSDFNRLLGFSFDDLCTIIHNEIKLGRMRTALSNFYSHTQKIDEAVKQKIINSEFYQRLEDFTVNYDMAVGDLMRLNSYGITKTDGIEAIKLIDYGATNEIIRSMYHKPKKQIRYGVY